MELTELQPSAHSASSTAGLRPDVAAAPEWRELVAQMGRETAVPLTAALERVNRIANTGEIDRAELSQMRDSIDRARRVGIIAQQIGRLASGRVQPAYEQLSLTQAVRDALAQRGRETQTRGIELRQELVQAEVIVDAAMLSALLQSMLDWSFEHARSPIDFRVELKNWPEHACLSCRFAHLPADEVAAPGQGLGGQPQPDFSYKLETMPWQLLHRLARALGLTMQRADTAGATHLNLVFPRTVGHALISLAGLDAPNEQDVGLNSRPMAGSHVLVIATRRETRNAVRETVQSMGLMVDYVSSVEEARDFCGHGLPHAVIYEAAIAGANFQKLRLGWVVDAPKLVFIEIAEDGHSHAISDLGGLRTSRIGRSAVLTALPDALLAELSQAV